MNSNKLSVIVPIYNVEAYLEGCVSSIQEQTHTNLEIILVNDGSTDRTARIAEELACRDARIRLIHKSNGGVTSARLRGVAEASGQWICFMDGDDTIEPDMYQRLLDNAIRENADISHCGYQMVFPDGHIDYYHNSGRRMVNDRSEGLIQLLDGSLIEPSLWNKLFRAELFNELPEIDLSIRYNEDILLNYHLFSRARVSVFEDICPYHYQLRHGSATASRLNLSRLEDPMRVTRIIQQTASGEPQLVPVLQARLVRQLISGATMPLKEDPALIRPHRRKCRQELRSLAFRKLEISRKLKFQAVWAALSPSSYGFVHIVYACLTGKYNLYAID